MSDYKIIVDYKDDFSLFVEASKLSGIYDDYIEKVVSIKKEGNKNIVTFSSGSEMVVKDGDTPYINDNGFWMINGQATGVNARGRIDFKDLTDEERLSIKGEKGDRGYTGDRGLPGLTGKTGEASKVTKTEYDSEGNTLITFNDNTTAKINRGKVGQKGDKGDSITTSSITKSGLTTTVTFTDGKSMKIQDGKSVKVDSYEILDDGNTEISFSDGKKAIVKKGQDGDIKFANLTEEEKTSFAKSFGLNFNDKVDKAAGKDLSDNNFSNLYKNKLDNLDKTIDGKIVNKVEKDEVKEQIQEVKDLVFDSSVKYANDTIYVLDTKVESGEVKVVPKEIGKLVANDFLKVNVDSDKYSFRMKSTSQGIILFYSMTDTALRYAIHVYPQIKDYEINFGKKVTGEMIFTSVTMPEDKVSVIREEGFNVN
ncbi:hypothetical protein [Anaerococcus hydrogenalis]|uniref:hypothetical protein n=1 Tax=Anaerococcus hydrogenalis TaxID=33029 RepID=UPI0023F337EB|nr:hypothetical protein [Anaerococcus hydrogenalis]